MNVHFYVKKENQFLIGLICLPLILGFLSFFLILSCPVTPPLIYALIIFLFISPPYKEPKRSHYLFLSQS